ncbi:MAG: hypothetical protein K0R05_4061 [Anaerocolumna sp.]|jgi:hypothetical protein|nr:hypothetical protein [Anaerocolumna sp.]
MLKITNISLDKKKAYCYNRDMKAISITAVTTECTIESTKEVNMLFEDKSHFFNNHYESGFLKGINRAELLIII